MAIKQPPGTTIADPADITTQIGLALANGGVYAIQTTQDIYVTQVTENTYRQTVNTTVNSPGGTTPGEVQFFDGRGFAADSAFKYDTDTDSLQLRGNLNIVGNINLTGALNGSGLLNLGTPATFTIAGGNPGDVLTTDGAGHMAWLSAAGATYSNANVGAFLPTYTGNISAGNATLGNLVTASFYAGTLTTPAQPNITSVGTLTTLAVTGAASTGPLTVAGTILSTGNIQGSNLSTPGNITGLNLAINNIVASGNLTLSKSIIAANVTATHFGDGGNLSNITGANVVGTVANATHALTADVAYEVAGANVVGVVANATHSIISDSALAVPGSGVIGNVATAVFAYTANTVVSIPGANVIGEVAFAAVANSVAAANVVGVVANAAHAVFATNAETVDGANVYGQVAFAAVANSVDGANVVGQVANALVAGTVYTAVQPNITSVGTLTGLTVDGTTALGAAGNVKITGGTSGQVLSTDGTGNLNWVTSSGLLPIATTTILGGVKPDGTTIVANLTGVISAVIPTDGGNLSNLRGGNVVGDVAGSNHSNIADVANSVAGANVVGNVASAVVANTANTAIRLSAPIANVSITGGTTGQVLSTNGSGVLSWATVAAGTVANGTTSMTIPAANAAVSFNIGGTAGVMLVNRISSSLAANWIPQTTNAYSLGSATVAWRNVFTGTVKMTPQTTAALGDPVVAGAGTKAFVTDSSAAIWGMPLIGGGSYSVPVFSDGTMWLVG